MWLEGTPLCDRFKLPFDMFENCMMSLAETCSLSLGVGEMFGNVDNGY